MFNLIVMVGIAGSGKTTYAEDWIERHPDYCLIATDSIREEIYGDASIQDNARRIFRIAHERLRQRLELGQSVIFDATSLTKKARKALLDIANEYPYVRKIACFIDTPIPICIARQAMRARKVPEDVIRRQGARLEVPQEAEGFDKVWIHTTT